MLGVWREVVFRRASNQGQGPSSDSLVPVPTPSSFLITLAHHFMIMWDLSEGRTVHEAVGGEGGR